MEKPTGTSGILRVGFDSQGKLASSFEKILFSKEKAEIELHMAQSFIRDIQAAHAAQGGFFPLSIPIQNPENDCDMTVDSPTGPAYMELVEVAPLNVFPNPTVGRSPPVSKPTRVAMEIKLHAALSFAA